MVRLINKDNIKIIEKSIVKYMKFQQNFTYFAEVNAPKNHPCIYAIWHSDQFCLHGMGKKNGVHILISNSLDGEIITYAANQMGFEALRGSTGKKGVIESSAKMIELLKQGDDIVITVDGPSGPYHTIKNGLIKLARISGAPIIPLVCYSEDKGVISLPTWDKMKIYLGKVRIINLYGDPVYISHNMPDEMLGEKKELIKNLLENLYSQAPEVYKDVMKKNLWKLYKV